MGNKQTTSMSSSNVSSYHQRDGTTTTTATTTTGGGGGRRGSRRRRTMMMRSKFPFRSASLKQRRGAGTTATMAAWAGGIPPVQHNLGDNLVVEKGQGDFYEDYKVVKRIVEGSISDVYLVEKLKQKQQRWQQQQQEQPQGGGRESADDENWYYVLKDIDMDVVEEDGIEGVENEIELLKTIDHPNIVKAYGVYKGARAMTREDQDDDHHHDDQQEQPRRDDDDDHDRDEHAANGRHVFIVMEYCSGGSLSSRMHEKEENNINGGGGGGSSRGGRKRSPPYTEKRAQQIVAKIVEAVHYLHTRGIVHTDLRLENVLFENRSPDAQIKLINFGLGQRKRRGGGGGGNSGYNKCHHFVRPLYASSPELVQGKRYNHKTDMWSIGVIAYILLSGGEDPFYGQDLETRVQKIVNVDYSTSRRSWDDVSNEAKSFVHRLLQYNPKSRYSSKQALSSPWLAEQTQRSCDDLSPDSLLTFLPSLRRELAAPPSPSMSSSSLSIKPIPPPGPHDDHTVTTAAMMDTSMSSLKESAPGSGGEFRKICFNTIARRAAAKASKDISRLREVFHAIDVDHDGAITFDELRRGLKSQTLSYQLEQLEDWSDADMRRWFDSTDVDKNGTIDYTEFLAAALEVTSGVDMEQIEEAFRVFDREGKGYITAEDMRTVLDLSSGGDDELYVRDLIDEADSNRDGMISFEEFTQVLLEASQREGVGGGDGGAAGKDDGGILKPSSKSSSKGGRWPKKAAETMPPPWLVAPPSSSRRSKSESYAPPRPKDDSGILKPSSKSLPKGGRWPKKAAETMPPPPSSSRRSKSESYAPPCPKDDSDILKPSSKSLSKGGRWPKKAAETMPPPPSSARRSKSESYAPPCPRRHEDGDFPRDRYYAGYGSARQIYPGAGGSPSLPPAKFYEDTFFIPPPSESLVAAGVPASLPPPQPPFLSTHPATTTTTATAAAGAAGTTRQQQEKQQQQRRRGGHPNNSNNGKRKDPMPTSIEFLTGRK